MTRRSVVRLLAVLAVGGLIAGYLLFVRDDEPVTTAQSHSHTSTSVRKNDPEVRQAFAALCRSAQEAKRGDVEDAERTFQDNAHEWLHEIAHQAEDSGHRDAAGDLLEAKERVEDGFPKKSPTVYNDLQALMTEAGKVSNLLGYATLPNCVT